MTEKRGEVQGGVAGKLGVQSLQELQKLLMTMPRKVLADDVPFHDVESGKQGRSAVTHIVVSVGATTPWDERQSRLRTIQRLDLALFVHAQDDRVLWGRQVDAHHVGEFLQEVRITREFESLGQMGLDLVILSDPVNRAFAHPLSLRQRARIPVGRSLGSSLQRRVHPLFYRSRTVARLAAPPGLALPNTAYALLANSPSPKGGRFPVNPKLLRRRLIGLAPRSFKDDLSPNHRLLGCRTRANPLLQTNDCRFLQRDCRTLA